MSNRATNARAGFSLMEILVALVLIGLLVGTLAPSVLAQMGRGEVNRIVEDLRAVEKAAKTFRVDVNRWPSDVEDLTTAITATDSVFASGVYPTALLGGWAGPYLEGEVVADGGTLATAAGGTISDNFASVTLNNATYLTVQVTGLETATMREISEVIDGDTSLTTGQVQAQTTTLRFLAAPVQ